MSSTNGSHASRPGSIQTDVLFDLVTGLKSEFEKRPSAEALRMLLRAGFPDATLPDEITDYGWFISARNRSIEREPTDLATAGTAIEEIGEGNRTGELQENRK